MKTIGTFACSFLFMASAFAADSPPDQPRAVTLGGIIHPDSDDTLAFTPDGNTVFFDASIAADGTLYFIRWDQQDKIMHIMRAGYRGGS
ncbi:MAG TPA: hypothetical protein VIC29_16270 [Steroidobacteraceae bacterium]|jgi:hypothetical protein